jgi:hypothetical protein
MAARGRVASAEQSRTCERRGSNSGKNPKLSSQVELNSEQPTANGKWQIANSEGIDLVIKTHPGVSSSHRGRETILHSQRHLQILQQRKNEGKQ